MASNTNSQRTAAAVPPTVLLVETDVLVRSVVAEYLRHCGYRVLEARNAVEAKALLSAGQVKVDLVFIDVRLGGQESGFALATWVRQTRQGIEVLLTGGIANAAQKAGVVCESGPKPAKPYSHAVVLARIQQLLHGAGTRGTEGL